MKILIASDSYKGSLSSLEVSKYIQKGFKEVFEDISFKTLSMADGGEGTVQAIVESLNGKYISVACHNALNEEIEASYGLIDNFAVYIVPSIISVYYMILINSYMSQLPKELEESATIDGANDIVIFFRIIMPVSVPIIATIALFVAINHWNSFFDSYLYTSKQNLKTLQAVMMNILNQYQTASLTDTAGAAANAARRQATSSDSIRMTATIVSTIPIIMVYPFVQKYFVSGIMMGAVKG